MSTTNSKEGDTDLETTLPGNIVVRVQVKYFYPQKGNLGDWVVDQLANSMDEGDLGLIATSGTISEEAIKKAKEYLSKCKKISFIDGNEFVDLIFDNLDSFKEEEFSRLGLSKIFTLI